MTPSFWRGRRVLLTGHTGFKGAWLALWLEALGADVSAFALAPEADALWSCLDPPPTSKTSQIDIRDVDAVTTVVRAAAPEIVLHLAAQAIVRRGYRDPGATFATNVQGTVNLIEALRAIGTARATIVVTSDKVYGGEPPDEGFDEDAPLGGVDPYSASKVACEQVVAAYAEAYFRPRSVAVATVRAGNIIGGGDTAQDRIVPDLVRAVNGDRVLRLRAPDALRPWQHVLDALAGYLLLAERMIERPADVAATLNFGPDRGSRRTVRELVEVAIARWGTDLKIEAETPMPAEPRPLWLNSTRARECLGWAPRLGFEETVRWTVDWWRAFAAGQTARAISARQIAAYAEMTR